VWRRYILVTVGSTFPRRPGGLADENAVVDLVQISLGEITQFQSLLTNQRKTVDIVNGKTGEVLRPAVPKDTADHIFLHGFHSSGATFSLSLRAGTQFDPTEPALRWDIYGSKGEIQITSASAFLNMSVGIKVRVKDSDGKIEEVEVRDGGKKGPAANVERVYEAFAKDDKRLASFADAVKRHRFLEELYGGKLGEPVSFASRT
jgi:predicted dehydrogenase